MLCADEILVARAKRNRAVTAASDSTDVHTHDSVTQPDGSPQRSRTVTGDTQTWNNNGTLPSAQLTT